MALAAWPGCIVSLEQTEHIRFKLVVRTASDVAQRSVRVVVSRGAAGGGGRLTPQMAIVASCEQHRARLEAGAGDAAPTRRTRLACGCIAAMANLVNQLATCLCEGDVAEPVCQRGCGCSEAVAVRSVGSVVLCGVRAQKAETFEESPGDVFVDEPIMDAICRLVLSLLCLLTLRPCAQTEGGLEVGPVRKLALQALLDERQYIALVAVVGVEGNQGLEMLQSASQRTVQQLGRHHIVPVGRMAMGDGEAKVALWVTVERPRGNLVGIVARQYQPAPVVVLGKEATSGFDPPLERSDHLVCRGQV